MEKNYAYVLGPLGLSFLFLSGIVDVDPYHSLLGNIAWVFLAVALVAIVNRLVNKVLDAMRVKRNGFHALGLIQCWPKRIDGMEWRHSEYLTLIAQADAIDLMGLNLSTDIFQHKAIRDAIVISLNKYRHRTVRVLISDPNRGMYRRRLTEYGEERQPELRTLLTEAFAGIKDIKERLDDPNQFRLSLHGGVVYAMILRFDDELFFTNYLSTVVGNETPSYHAKKVDGDSLYSTYRKEFNEAFAGGRTVQNIDDVLRVEATHLPTDSFPTTSTRQLYEDKLLSVRRDTISKLGKPVGERVVVEYRPAAAIVALKRQEQKVLLIGHYRHAVGKWLWEIPGGMREPGENGEACVRREIKEEAGCDVRNVRSLLTFHPEPALSNHVIELYEGEVSGESLRRLESDQAEIPTVKFFPFSQALEMIDQRLIASSWSVIGLLTALGEGE